MATSTSPTTSRRQRVPAAERRDALIEAAVHEFAHGGLHGTPVDRIARRVGVAQPYVFSLFASKRELFLAAVERGFELDRRDVHARRRPSSTRRSRCPTPTCSRRWATPTSSCSPPTATT